MARKTHPNSKTPHMVSEILLKGYEYELCGTIEEVIKKLEEIQITAATINCQNVMIDIETNMEYDYGGPYAKTEVIIQGIRPETQQEIDARRAKFKKKSEASKKAAAKRKKDKEAEELAMYEKLKEKFGDK